MDIARLGSADSSAAPYNDYAKNSIEISPVLLRWDGELVRPLFARVYPIVR